MSGDGHPYRDRIRAIRFYLKSRAGWQETDPPGGVNVNIGGVVNMFSPEVIEAKREARERAAAEPKQHGKNSDVEVGASDSIEVHALPVPGDPDYLAPAQPGPEFKHRHIRARLLLQRYFTIPEREQILEAEPSTAETSRPRILPASSGRKGLVLVARRKRSLKGRKALLERRSLSLLFGRPSSSALSICHSSACFSICSACF